jgi:hypothetical protein
MVSRRNPLLFRHGVFIQDRFLAFGIEPNSQISEGAIIARSPNPPHALRRGPCWIKIEALYRNRRGAKTYRLLLHVCHSCEVPGEI